jgi:hypothetical protein
MFFLFKKISAQLSAQNFPAPIRHTYTVLKKISAQLSAQNFPAPATPLTTPHPL